MSNPAEEKSFMARKVLVLRRDLIAALVAVFVLGLLLGTLIAQPYYSLIRLDTGGAGTPGNSTTAPPSPTAKGLKQ